jgi:hypothetical protein
VDGVKYLDHKQMLSLAKILTNTNKPISALRCPVAGGIRNSKRKINYDILPDGSETDNAEAAWNGERGSNGKINALAAPAVVSTVAVASSPE